MSEFKRRHFQGEVILWPVRWYCRCGMNYRDNTDKASACDITILELKAEGKCPEELVHRLASGLRTLKTAHATIKGFEVMRALRKGQAAIFNLIGGIRGEARIVEQTFGVGPSGLTGVVAIPARNPNAKAA